MTQIETQLAAMAKLRQDLASYMRHFQDVVAVCEQDLNLIKALRRALASLSERHHPSARRDIAAILSGEEEVEKPKPIPIKHSYGRGDYGEDYTIPGRLSGEEKE